MEEKEKKAQEMYLEFQALDQHIKQLQKQLQAVTHQLLELDATSMSIDEFKNLKAGKDIFVPLSSGIFAKGTLGDTSELIVNVGANVAVRKDVAAAKKLIDEQIEELKKIQKKMSDELEKRIMHAAQLEQQLHDLIKEEQS